MAGRSDIQPIGAVAPCPGGWLVLPARLAGITVLHDEPFVAATLLEALDYRPTFMAAAIQVPIGFRSEPTGGWEPFDHEARELLGWPRGAAYAPTPSRAALNAASAAEARVLEPWLTDGDLRRFRWLRESAALFEPYHQRRWVSAHADLSYVVLNGDRPLITSPFLADGVSERIELISRQMPGVEQIFDNEPPDGADLVHLLQVAALLWTARRSLGHAAVRLPVDPDWDELGLRRELVL